MKKFFRSVLLILIALCLAIAIIWGGEIKSLRSIAQVGGNP